MMCKWRPRERFNQRINKGGNLSSSYKYLIVHDWFEWLKSNICPQHYRNTIPFHIQADVSRVYLFNKLYQF